MVPPPDVHMFSYGCGRFYLLAAFVIVSTIVQLLITSMYEHANEDIEHTVMKACLIIVMAALM